MASVCSLSPVLGLQPGPDAFHIHNRAAPGCRCRQSTAQHAYASRVDVEVPMLNRCPQMHCGLIVMPASSARCLPGVLPVQHVIGALALFV